MHKKIFLFLIIIFCVALSLTGCKKGDTLILLNHRPITKDTYLENDFVFKTGERIYYLFMTQKALKTDFVRVKILKRDEKVNYEITKLVYSNDYKLYKDQVYYYNDYIVLHQAGYYSIEIYSRNKLNKILSRENFRVINN